MSYNIISDYRNDDGLRALFNALAEKTFGLSFESWYKNGFWNEKYIPYSILLDGRIISNVSVNIINCTVGGKKRRYIQLGTIMTDEDFRNKGFSRILMEKVISEYSDRDGIFLFANDSVLDFYPKFGFRAADEYRFRAVNEAQGKARVSRVPMNDISPVKTDTDDLLMFYLSQFMQECVYKVSDKNCYIIAEKDGDTLTVFDILSDKEIDPAEIGSYFGSEVRSVSFAFIPENSGGLEKYLYKEDDSTFFVLGKTLISDLPEILSFPALVHA